MPGNILQNLQGLRLFGAFGPSRLCTRVVTLREATVAEQVEKRDRPARDRMFRQPQFDITLRNAVSGQLLNSNKLRASTACARLSACASSLHGVGDT